MFDDLIHDMRRARHQVEGLPTDKEYTTEELEDLEELLHQAIGLKYEIEAFFEVINGCK